MLASLIELALLGRAFGLRRGIEQGEVGGLSGLFCLWGMRASCVGGWFCAGK